MKGKTEKYPVELKKASIPIVGLHNDNKNVSCQKFVIITTIFPLNGNN